MEEVEGEGEGGGKSVKNLIEKFDSGSPSQGLTSPGMPPPGKPPAKSRSNMKSPPPGKNEESINDMTVEKDG